MSTYDPGHGPTSTDYTYATQYAEDVMKKAACLAQPYKYEWVPSSTTRYPCPEGLVCESGVCKFRKHACEQASELPYYDCVRRPVSCTTHPSGVCEVCDYSISLGRQTSGPYTTGDVPEGCTAGDAKYVADVEYPTPYTTPVLSRSGFCDNDQQCGAGSSCVMPEPDEVMDHWGMACTSTDDCGGGRSVCANGHCVSDTMYEGQCVVECTSSSDCHPGTVCGQDPGDAALYGRCYTPVEPVQSDRLCQPITINHKPYTVKNYEGEQVVDSPVPCEVDEHCWFPPGVGGVCGRDPSLPTYGYCYDPSLPPYLEWRDEVQFWTDMPPSKNVCVETQAYPRQWCEMPWTRAGPNTDNPTDPLSVRVKRSWKSRARPPFWYDERDSSCHVTKTYCTANLKNGGYSAGYGRSHDYWLGSTCGGTTDGEVVGAYDCCTKLGNSIGEFFLGRTLTTDFRELVEGDVEGFGSRWERYMERLAEETQFELGPVRGNAVMGLQGDILREGNPGLAETLDFVCDPRLKQGIRLIASNVVGPGIPIHGYEWVWNATATRLYGFKGADRGMLTSEVEKVFPNMVQTGCNGYRHISIDPLKHHDRWVYNALIRLKDK